MVAAARGVTLTRLWEAVDTINGRSYEWSVRSLVGRSIGHE